MFNFLKQCWLSYQRIVMKRSISLFLFFWLDLLWRFRSRVKIGKLLPDEGLYLSVLLLDFFQSVELLFGNLDSMGFFLLLWHFRILWYRLFVFGWFFKPWIFILWLIKFFMAVHSIMALLVHFLNYRDLFLKKYRIRVLASFFHFPQLFNIAFKLIDIGSDLLGFGFVDIMMS